MFGNAGPSCCLEGLIFCSLKEEFLLLLSGTGAQIRIRFQMRICSEKRVFKRRLTLELGYGYPNNRAVAECKLVSRYST